MEAAGSFKPLVPIYWASRRHIPWDGNQTSDTPVRTGRQTWRHESAVYNEMFCFHFTHCLLSVPVHRPLHSNYGCCRLTWEQGNKSADTLKRFGACPICIRGAPPDVSGCVVNTYEWPTLQDIIADKNTQQLTGLVCGQHTRTWSSRGPNLQILPLPQHYDTSTMFFHTFPLSITPLRHMGGLEVQIRYVPSVFGFP
jgi:hypothetical protein